MHLKHLFCVSSYLQVHENAKMQHLFSVSLQDLNYSWQGGASTVGEIIGTEQSGRTHFLPPLSLVDEGHQKFPTCLLALESLGLPGGAHGIHTVPRQSTTAPNREITATEMFRKCGWDPTRVSITE